VERDGASGERAGHLPASHLSPQRAPHSLDAPLSLAAGSLAVSHDGSISAELSHPSRPRPLVLRLSALPPHALRLQIDEDYSTATPPHRRFHVPDVLLPDLEARTLHFPEPKTAAGVSTVALSSDLDVVVKHDPFELTVRRAGSGDPVLSFNSHGLFDFEPMRESKPEDETWEEHFRSHTDKRPRGPQSITFDVSFYGAHFVYGLPEHGSTSLALRPTRGPGVEESEPYRLFNLDVFEYLHESPFGLYGSIQRRCRSMCLHQVGMGPLPRRTGGSTHCGWLRLVSLMHSSLLVLSQRM